MIELTRGIENMTCSLAGQTLTRGGESLVKFPSGFGVAYSAAAYLMK